MVVGILVYLTTLRPRVALMVALDLVLAAGLLRLTASDDWGSTLAVAAVVLVRLVVGRHVRALVPVAHPKETGNGPVAPHTP